MVIEGKEFGGIAPRYPLQELQPPYAEVAQNLKMERGQLRGFAGRTRAFASSVIHTNAQTLLSYKPETTEYLLSWTQKVKAVLNPLPNDAYKRIYWTGDGAPKMIDFTNGIDGGAPSPTMSFPLGVPSPETPVTLLRVVGDGNENAEAEGKTPYYRRYTVTFVTQFGEESGPYVSATVPLPEIILYEGDSVQVSDIPTPTGNGAWGNGAKKRIYQTDTAGNLLLAVEVPLATTEITFDHMAVGTSLLQTAATEPPPDTMQNLTRSMYGFMYGSNGNTLCVSDVYLFHSWPSIYQQAVDGNIMGIVATVSGAIVLTDKGTYLARGVDPTNIQISNIDSASPCVSADSIVDMGGFAMFASSDGVIMATDRETVNVTKDFILDVDWPALSPENFSAQRHKSRYMFWDNSSGYSLDPNGDSSRLTSIDFAFGTTFNYVRDGGLYYLESGLVYEFDSDPTSPINYNWKSAIHRFPKAVDASCVRIDADDFSDLTINFYVNGQALYSSGLVLDGAVSNNGSLYFRIKPYRPVREIQFSLAGSSPVSRIYFSNSFAELQGVV